MQAHRALFSLARVLDNPDPALFRPLCLLAGHIHSVLFKDLLLLE